MIDGLIGGKLYGKATQKTGPSGKPYVIAKVRTAVQDGEGVFVNVITFSGKAGKSLLALEDGDSVSLSGALTPKVWTPPNGDPRVSLDMVAHGVLTAYHVTRKRRAIEDADTERKTPARSRRASAADVIGMEDDLPWSA